MARYRGSNLKDQMIDRTSLLLLQLIMTRNDRVEAGAIRIFNALNCDDKANCLA